MDLTIDKRNILAYRILTLGELRVMTLREYGKQVHDKETGDLLNGLRPDLDSQDVIAINGVLEDVYYQKARMMSIGNHASILTLTVNVVTSEEEREEVDLEFLLTPRHDNNPKDLCKVLVIEEE